MKDAAWRRLAVAVRHLLVDPAARAGTALGQLRRPGRAGIPAAAVFLAVSALAVTGGWPQASMTGLAEVSTCCLAQGGLAWRSSPRRRRTCGSWTCGRECWHVRGRGRTRRSSWPGPESISWRCTCSTLSRAKVLGSGCARQAGLGRGVPGPLLRAAGGAAGAPDRGGRGARPGRGGGRRGRHDRARLVAATRSGPGTHGPAGRAGCRCPGDAGADGLGMTGHWALQAGPGRLDGIPV